MVSNKNICYPQNEEDHELLSRLKVPITKITLDDFILLTIFCKKKHVKVHVTNFVDLEQAMLAKVRAKWKHEFVDTEYSLIFTYLKTAKLKTNTEEMALAIKKWYARHYIQTEVVTKRTSKAFKIVIKKVG